MWVLGSSSSVTSMTLENYEFLVIRLRLWVGLNLGGLLGYEIVKAGRSHSPCLFNSPAGDQRPFWWDDICFQIKIYFPILTRSSSYCKFHCKVGKGLKRSTFWGSQAGVLGYPIEGSLPTYGPNTDSLTQRTMLWIIGFTLVHLFRPKPICFPISYRWSFRDTIWLLRSLVYWG